ncbi:hypothetical protein, partial [uncultured Ruegeria sp.]|uniref:hypothetical protein n=1 Tax=uncultured Ruegeria sp. TaxID=259304 RepID=UPI002618E47C
MTTTSWTPPNGSMMRPDVSPQRNPLASGAAHPPFEAGVSAACMGLEVVMHQDLTIRPGDMDKGPEKLRNCAR